jgi:hypothetical protein
MTSERESRIRTLRNWIELFLAYPISGSHTDIITDVRLRHVTPARMFRCQAMRLDDPTQFPSSTTRASCPFRAKADVQDISSQGHFDLLPRWTQSARFHVGRVIVQTPAAVRPSFNCRDHFVPFLLSVTHCRSKWPKERFRSRRAL